MKLKKYDKIEVIWIDSNCNSGWHNTSSYKEAVDKLENEFVIKDIGYFMEWTKNYLIMVQGYDKQEKPNHSYINAIPRGVIKNIRKLK